MDPITTFTGRVVPLPVRDIDTDQIIPARFLKTIDKQGLGKNLFNDWRYEESGDPNPEFILNQPRAEGATILLAGDNFGCGSSREHAPWALMGFGFRAVISTSFADIFRNNCLKNSLLPVIVDEATHGELFEAAERDEAIEVGNRPSQANGAAALGPRGAIPDRRIFEEVPARRRRSTRLLAAAVRRGRRIRSRPRQAYRDAVAGPRASIFATSALG